MDGITDTESADGYTTFDEISFPPLILRQSPENLTFLLLVFPSPVSHSLSGPWQAPSQCLLNELSSFFKKKEQLCLYVDIVKRARLAHLVPGKKHELVPAVFLEPVEDALCPMLRCVHQTRQLKMER